MALSLLTLGGCTGMLESDDFERHRGSQLVMPLNGGDIFYFDARITPQLPDDDPAAEARRVTWLESWLQLRKLCGSGYEILARRPFRFQESNPGRFDLRYELRCRSQPEGGRQPGERSQPPAS